MNIVTVTIVLFGLLILFIATGLPLAFAFGSLAVVINLWLFGTKHVYLVASYAVSEWTNFIIVAVPLFILMASFLEKSGIADDLYEMMYRWGGGLRGGLAMGTVVICAIFAAMSGVSATATVTMGLIALPSMLKRNYDKFLATGTISAGGTLGILIPPSVPMILYASVTGESVGKLFMGGVLSGVALALIYIAYIGIRSFLQPELAPALPREERADWGSKLASLKAVILPAGLIFLVLGAIYTGAATPTEAAGIGASGALVCSLARRRLTWQGFVHSLRQTFIITAMCLWIILGAKFVVHTYLGLGANDFILRLVSGLNLNRWVIIGIMQLILLVLGCFLDPFGIILICTPIFVPIVKSLGFDTLWFAILFVINLEIGFITPPFGLNLFFMKAVAPPEVSMGNIIKASLPFVFLGILGIIVVMLFP
ncbi:MAG: TRAP transporter large permease subunit, partial [Chloroflexota bacterium]